jgi:hypothetical protein
LPPINRYSINRHFQQAEIEYDPSILKIDPDYLKPDPFIFKLDLSLFIINPKGLNIKRGDLPVNSSMKKSTRAASEITGRLFPPNWKKNMKWSVLPTCSMAYGKKKERSKRPLFLQYIDLYFRVLFPK